MDTRPLEPVRDPVSARPLEWEKSPVVAKRPNAPMPPSGEPAGVDPAALVIAFIICALILWFMLGKH
jgi:hypothetical protein